MRFEGMPLQPPTAEEETRKHFLKLKQELVGDRQILANELAGLQDLADEWGVDLNNDYQKQVADSDSYLQLRNRLLARKKALFDELEASEGVFDDVLEHLGETREHDA